VVYCTWGHGDLGLGIGIWDWDLGFALCDVYVMYTCVPVWCVCAHPWDCICVYVCMYFGVAYVCIYGVCVCEK